MILDLIWLVPAFATIFLLFALYRLGSSGKKLLRQQNRLNKALSAFQATDHSESLKPVQLEPTDLRTAESNRKAYVNKRTKAKAERQRRLVKRLRDLKSNESE
jgi:hypothetical protein